MKPKRIFCAAIGASLALSAALSLSACKNKAVGNESGPKYLGTATGEFSFADYLSPDIDVNDLSHSADGITAVTKINKTGETFEGSRGALAVLSTTSNSRTTYRVYSADLGANIASNVSSQPTLGLLGGFEMVTVPSDGKSAVYAADGTVILPAAEYENVNADTSLYFVNQDEEQSTVLRVTAIKYDEEGPLLYETVRAFFVVEKDKQSGAVSFTAVDEDKLHASRQDDEQYEVGDYLNARRPVYAADPSRPVEGDIADYSYTVTLGNTYTFYKDRARVGSVTLEYGTMLGFVGNYMYYKTETPVYREATGGFNYVSYDG